MACLARQRHFNIEKKKNESVNNREQRAAIAQDTLAILKRGHYRNLHGDHVDIGEAIQSAISQSIHYRGDALRVLAAQQTPDAADACEIQVNNESTLAAASRLVAQGHDVLCLNFASARNPGGGFLGGSEAQEENLAKSSALYPCIAQMTDMYEANRKMTSCVYLDDMIYSPQVPVFRDDAYQYLDAAYQVSIVTAPAVNSGAVARNEPERVSELANIMRQRIELLLALAKHHGHQTLVLGAWGCGVFGNDPGEMASWFALHLRDNPVYRNAFRQVCFAVLDRRDNGTYAAFAKQFGSD
ncbi:TIGR02452 family protein [Chitinimonas arctica]|uniref:TIGR02452 family protein n=1 Tax=Chitinimonas arctica TaxID=2594795 RepID=A0A516SIC6_9NEIS|nr:TIGR02452 family protein [Chitinimonas arctica]QDQ27909.1 TIGR02452 family protein [Chitinimonas arctica]